MGSSLTTGSSACEQDVCSCFIAVVVCPRTTSKAFQFLGLGCGLSEGGSLPSGVGGVISKAAASIFVPSIAVPSRPPQVALIISDLPTFSPSLSPSLGIVRRNNEGRGESPKPSHLQTSTFHSLRILRHRGLEGKEPHS